MSAELDALWLAVRHVAVGRVELIAAAVCATGDDAARQRVCAVEECHKLVGSLGSYGRDAGSQLALVAAGLLEAAEPDLAALDEVVAGLRAVVAT